MPIISHANTFIKFIAAIIKVKFLETVINNLCLQRNVQFGWSFFLFCVIIVSYPACERWKLWKWKCTAKQKVENSLFNCVSHAKVAFTYTFFFSKFPQKKYIFSLDKRHELHLFTHTHTPTQNTTIHWIDLKNIFCKMKTCDKSNKSHCDIRKIK